MLVAVLVWLVTAVTVALFAIRRWWLPEAINAHARAWDSHFGATMWIMGAIFVVAQIALGWVVTRVIRSPQPPNPPANIVPAAK